MRSVLAAFAWYPFFLVPALTGIFIIWMFFRRRIKLIGWDLLLITLPWLFWIALNSVEDFTRSLSNVVIEPIILGFLTSIAFLARCIISKNQSQSVASVSVTIAMCIVSVLFWAFFPGLPE